MNGYDDGLLNLTADRSAGRIVLDGLGLHLPAGLVLSSTVLAIGVRSGIAVIEHKKQAFHGQGLTINGGNTLADLNGIHAVIIAAWDPNLQTIVISAVDGTEALIAAAVIPTDAEIEATLHAHTVEHHWWAKLGVVSFERTTAVIALAFDMKDRPYGIRDDAHTPTAPAYPPASSSAGEFGPIVEFGTISLDAADLANADFGSANPPADGFYEGVRMTTEKVLGGGSAAVTTAELNTVVVTGVTIAAIPATHATTEDAPTNEVWIKPGDALNYVFASTTAGTGRIRVSHLLRPFIG